MIKKLLITSTIILTSFTFFAQDNNEFRVYYGISDSKLLRNEELIGVGSNDFENFTEFGFRYLRRINDGLAVETGIRNEEYFYL